MNLSWEAIAAIGSTSAVIVSLVSLAIVVYKEYVQGPKLHSSVNQVILMRLAGENKASLKKDMILDDLFSDTPSRQARAFLDQNPVFQESIDTRNRDRLLGELTAISRKQMMNYNPTIGLVKRYLEDERYSISFLVPLVIFNSGRKFAHISSLIMIAHLKNQPEKKWAYTVFLEIDPIKVVQREKGQKDTERVSNLFSGFAVAPGESVQVNPCFTSMTDPGIKTISRERMKPDDYVLEVFGYDCKSKRVLTTKPVEYSIFERPLLKTFFGSESAHYIDVGKHVVDATKE